VNAKTSCCRFAITIEKTTGYNPVQYENLGLSDHRTKFKLGKRSRHSASVKARPPRLAPKNYAFQALATAWMNDHETEKQ